MTAAAPFLAKVVKGESPGFSSSCAVGASSWKAEQMLTSSCYPISGGGGGGSGGGSKSLDHDFDSFECESEVVA